MEPTRIDSHADRSSAGSNATPHSSSPSADPKPDDRQSLPGLGKPPATGTAGAGTPQPVRIGLVGVLTTLAVIIAAVAFWPHTATATPGLSTVAAMTSDVLPAAVAQQRLQDWQHAVMEVKPIQQNGQDSIELFVWDDYAQDGDVVTLVSGNTQQTVSLLNAGTTVILPRPANGTVTIVGVHDGGGGITLGIRGSGNPLFTPVMQPGEQLTLRVK